MKAFLSTVIASAMVLLAAQAHADGLRLGDPAYGGSGCPAGSVGVTVSPDQSAVSFLFDQYLTEAGNTTGRQVDRKSCNITVPVHVPQGYSVALFQVDYRGFNALPAGARARFNAEYFWAGSQGPRFMKNFVGPINADFTLSNELAASTLVWTRCGESVNLRVNTSLMTNTNNAFQQAMSSVDSADVSAGLIYHIQWKRCY